jgi:hypothetical protein
MFPDIHVDLGHNDLLFFSCESRRTKDMSSCKMFSVQLTHSEDAAERGVSDPAVLGEGNVALDLIIHLVAADDEYAATLEQFIRHFLSVFDFGRGVAFQKCGHEQYRADGRVSGFVCLTAVVGSVGGVFKSISPPGGGYIS